MNTPQNKNSYELPGKKLHEALSKFNNVDLQQYTYIFNPVSPVVAIDGSLIYFPVEMHKDKSFDAQGRDITYLIQPITAATAPAIDTPHSDYKKVK